MLDIFTWLADWATAKMGLDITTHLGQAVHFFIEDTLKIFDLCLNLFYFIIQSATQS